MHRKPLQLRFKVASVEFNTNNKARIRHFDGKCFASVTVFSISTAFSPLWPFFFFFLNQIFEPGT